MKIKWEWKDGIPLDEQLSRRLEMTFYQAQAHGVRTVKELQEFPGLGRWYGKHQASARGQAPAVDTGQHVQAAGGMVEKTSKGFALVLGVEATEGSELAISTNALEFGVKKNRSRFRLAPRPAYVPTGKILIPLMTGMMATGEAFAYSSPPAPIPHGWAGGPLDSLEQTRKKKASAARRRMAAAKAKRKKRGGGG